MGLEYFGLEVGFGGSEVAFGWSKDVGRVLRREVGKMFGL